MTHFVSNCMTNMSDFNLFSSKTDFKKLLFTTKKFPIEQESWQDLSGVSSTLIFDTENTNSWQTINDYTTIPKSYGEQMGYCRLDRGGQWLLLSPPPLLQKDTTKVVTYYDNKRLSRDSILQENEHTFPDSCESLTVSIDFHVSTDELMADNDDINMVVWRNKIQKYENISSNETCRISR